MATKIVNGKKVNISSATTATEKTKKKIFMISPVHAEKINPANSVLHERFPKAHYSGNKTNLQREIIADQAAYLSKKFFKTDKYELDPDRNWVIFNGLILPQAWQSENPMMTTVKMMLVIPDEYPELPTEGFYLPISLRIPTSLKHIYDLGSNSETDIIRDWKKYFVPIKPSEWHPAQIHTASDWLHGDNLWDIVTRYIDYLKNPNV